MRADKSSGTAYRVALRRAAHQVFDDPVVFHDPLALRILGLEGKPLGGTDLRAPTRPHSLALRAFLVARSQFAEETLATALHDTGVTQYVLLGAGLDTFAYRHTHPGLRVFEVDHPATQAEKLRRLRAHGIVIPTSVAYVPVDFTADELSAELARAGFAWNERALFAWLGVVPYLTVADFTDTLRAISLSAPGSTLVMDYGLPREALGPIEQLAFDSLAARVAASGEPFQLFFRPEEIRDRLAAVGWTVLEDLGRDAINARWFAGRSDGLRVLSNAGRFLSARLAVA